MTSLDDIHNVGTFVQITELHDTGDQLRMIIQGHRRYNESIGSATSALIISSVGNAHKTLEY